MSKFFLMKSLIPHLEFLHPVKTEKPALMRPMEMLPVFAVASVPFRFPYGDSFITTELAATGWHIEHNHSHDNPLGGYLVVIGANNNTLVDNQGGNNGTYDIELTTNTNRFGFPVPGSFENHVDAGIFPNVTIKDCGEGNTVTGGIQINTERDICL